MIKAIVCDEAVSLYPIDTSENAASASNSNLETGGPEPKKKQKSLFKPKDQENPNSPVSSEEKAQCEVATYLKVPKLDTESKPLQWWKLKLMKVLNLA